MKRLAAVAFIALLLNTLPVWAQSSIRVQFPRGRTTAILEGKVDEATLGKADYVLRARAGQKMLVHITSPKKNAHFRIYRTDYDAPLQGAEDAEDWSGTLPESGDYHIYVFPTTSGTVPYTLEVTILAENQSRQNAQQPPASAPTNKPPASGREPSYQFDAGNGAYVFDGKAPKGFENLDALEFPGVLLNLSPDGSRVQSVASNPQANVFLKRGRQFKAQRVTLTGDQISFETESVGGISYQFTGKFIKGSVDRNELLDATLQGRLTKLQNGKKIAEAQMSFFQVQGG